MKVHYYEESILQNLKDAGCDKEITDTFINDLQAENQVKAMLALQKHRNSLLNDLHKIQKRIDCLDYLVFKLKRKKER